MELNDNTSLEHADDKFLWRAKLIANILLGVGIALFVIIGIIVCVKVSLWGLLYIFVGPVACFIAWVFSRVLLSLCHDVKIIRNNIMTTNPTAAQTPTTANAEAEEAPAITSEKAFCMNCGEKRDDGAAFCPKCGTKF